MRPHRRARELKQNFASVAIACLRSRLARRLSSLEDRVVLVTGAAGAVGSATVDAIIEAGGRVLAVDADPDALQRAFVSDAVDTAVLDVTSEQDWERTASYVANEWGRLDGLVTCAAIMHGDDGDLEAMSQKAWELTHAVNTTGAMLASRAALALMRPLRRGVIIHVSSIAASRGSATAQVAYTTSKGAVAALTRELAVAYAPVGIRVNAIAPGLLDSPLTHDLVAVPSELARRLAHIPMGRLGLPHEVAAATTWLLSDAAAYVTGTELVVDGGLSAAFTTGRE